jgi:purine-binding chemotaxis protein CheW
MDNTSISEQRPYLTFKLADEMFGVDVGQVREILDYVKITKVPQTPDFMKGVINLRGSVVPVVDMRLKFSMEEAQKTVDTCIVVLEIKIEGDINILGVLVDSVQEVFNLEPNEIEPAPQIGTSLKTNFIKGMGKHDDQFIILLNIDQIFSSEELTVINQYQNETAESVS